MAAKVSLAVIQDPVAAFAIGVRDLLSEAIHPGSNASASLA
jgi:hypothetical protein